MQGKNEAIATVRNSLVEEDIQEECSSARETESSGMETKSSAQDALVFDDAHKGRQLGVENGTCVSKHAEHEATPEQRQKITDAHEFGHFGVTATLHRLHRQNDKWPGMKAHVEALLQDCKACQAWTLGKHAFAPLRSSRVRLPWSQLQIDLLTSLPETSDGYKYVLVVICVFSGFVLLRALRTKQAVEIGEVLWLIFCDFGPPKVLMSDNEPTMVSEVLEAIIERHGAEHRTIAEYNSRALGSCEKCVGTSAITIRKLLAHAGGEWKKVMPFAQLSINVKAQERSGSLPFEILFNRQLHEFQDFRRFPMDDADSELWHRHQRHVHEVLFPSLAARLQHKQTKAAQVFARNKLKAKTLESGTMVMLADEQNRDSKNHPPYVGPYWIDSQAKLSNKVQHHVYRLRDKVGRLLERPVPIDQLKILPKATSVPGKSNWFYVDELLDHRSRKGKHEYLVKWKGYPVSAATWEDAMDIDESLVQDFMRKAKRVPNKQRIQQQ